jgi:predicted MFS family arabinose efflux permease
MSSTLAAESTGAEAQRGRLGRLALLASIVISFLAASAAPTPLYQHYDQVWHGTALTTTEAFGVYALAVLAGLLVFGEISNHLGRRPVLVGALVLQIVAVALFATAGSFEPLFAGRIVQGVAAGAALGTLGAAMIEAHRVHGTVASSAAPGLGTGTGALAAGLVVGYLPWPTHLIYLVLIAVFALQIVGVALILEPSPTRRGLARSLRPTLAVPAAARQGFAAAAPVLFSVWALAGLYGSLGPALVRDLSGSSEVALGGVALFILAGVASVTTVVRRDHDARAQLVGGTVALLAGVLATIAAVAAHSLWAYLAATAISGIGFGSGFQGGIRSVVPLAGPEERPGLLSAAYLVSYAGLGLPAVVAGFLVSRGLSLDGVAIGYGAALAILALASLALLRRRRDTAV